MYFVFTSILTGSRRAALSNFYTFEVIVAENKKVFLSFGIYVKIILICFSKSIERRRSASSSTKYLNFFRWNPLVFAMWSATLPGVPTTIWGFLLSAMAYETISRPPTKTAVLNPTVDPIASNWSAI